MAPPWPLVIFDFDGTLMDTEAGIVWAMGQTVQTLDLPPTLKETWRGMIGLSLETQAQLLLPNATAAERIALQTTYRDFYGQVLTQAPTPFPGAEALLLELIGAGLKLAIASSKRQWAILKILDQLGWTVPIAPIITPTEVARPKPDPESVQRILTYHELPATAAILVGDAIFDMQTARNAGIHACGVGWGVHTKTELLAHGADHWVADFAALGRLLLRKTSP
ncbi:HAD family hydrolase [Candidatus Cyanaurora vandensis]|uniref:HAD family hydrolase n=1 Tax=Candidatus Cyanaurora vandensis TaxID=2714958 RepID=UPI002580BE88|nr:HAD family hydrolase [Candidatus Cyanaurora vandensis]